MQDTNIHQMFDDIYEEEQFMAKPQSNIPATSMNMPDFEDAEKFMEERQSTKKDLFIDDFKRVWQPQVLVVAIMLPNGAVEVITNYQKLNEKFEYYLNAYDDNMELKGKDGLISIENWMVV